MQKQGRVTLRGVEWEATVIERTEEMRVEVESVSLVTGDGNI